MVILVAYLAKWFSSLLHLLAEEGRDQSMGLPLSSEQLQEPRQRGLQDDQGEDHRECMFSGFKTIA